MLLMMNSLKERGRDQLLCLVTHMSSFPSEPPVNSCSVYARAQAVEANITDTIGAAINYESCAGSQARDFDFPLRQGDVGRGFGMGAGISGS